MTGPRFPAGFRIEPLRKDHARKTFRSGQASVDDWLASKALQNQEKRLSTTKVLLSPNGSVSGFYTLATGQVDFTDLPGELVKRLPKRALPVAVLAWLGVDTSYQGMGLGGLLLAQSLHDCHQAGKLFSFIAVILDCIDESAKRFYQRWNFEELPGNPSRLFLSAASLDALMRDP